MKVGLVQTPVTSDTQLNIRTALKGIATAAQHGAQVVCLQELFALPYIGTRKDDAYFTLAEPIPGATTTLLAAAARKHGVVLIGGSIFEKASQGYFNTAVVFNSDGRMLGTYRKIHIPHDPHYWEQHYFSPGDLGYKVFDTSSGKIGVLICYDQWFPEAARILALQGAQIIFYPTAIGWTQAMKEHEKHALQNWIDVQRSHAITNHVFIAAVNRVGKEDDAIDFWGNSFVADPFGSIVTQATLTEQVIVADCDFTKILEAHQWMFLDNRRPDTYGRLTQ